MRRNLNQKTQPFREMPVFQNWEVVAEGWYYACRSKDVGIGKAQSLDLCGQHVVLFRGEDGVVRALDGFCPHMGTDLGIGTVKGNHLACFFHHWEFDGGGACRRIPCGDTPPSQACLRAYATAEKFGAIWVFPNREPAFPLPDFDELAGEDAAVAFAKSYPRTCHHHVTMINGIDAQHLRTVHGFDVEMKMEIVQKPPDRIDFSLEGQLPHQNRVGRLAIRLLGPEYGYAMRYSAGTIGLLTILRKVRLFGCWPLPHLHMIFAYRPVRFGETLVQPIYVTRKRKGLAGWLVERCLLGLTCLAFHRLKGEDGRVYDNMRFNPVSLLEMDRPIDEFITFINRLEPSIWSRVSEREPDEFDANAGDDLP